MFFISKLMFDDECVSCVVLIILQKKVLKNDG